MTEQPYHQRTVPCIGTCVKEIPDRYRFPRLASTPKELDAAPSCFGVCFCFVLFLTRGRSDQAKGPHICISIPLDVEAEVIAGSVVEILADAQVALGGQDGRMAQR